jgi:TRAP-type C4-dicarboxylate transport system permease large subunit
LTLDVLALLLVLLLVTFIPEISLWLPHALGYGVAL